VLAFLLIALVAACATAGERDAATKSRGSAAPAGGQRTVTTGKGETPAVDVGLDLDPNMVATEVSRHLGAVRECYVEYLKLDPSLSGRVVVLWTIANDGTVSRVNIGENIPIDAVASACAGRSAYHFHEWRTTTTARHPGGPRASRSPAPSPTLRRARWSSSTIAVSH
jgi:hypothetical protein